MCSNSRKTGFPGFAAVLVLAVLTAVSTKALSEERGELATVKNVKFVYTVTEPRPKQYQVYITGAQTDHDRSCYLFVAHVETVDHRLLGSGKLDGVASFVLEPQDFGILLWLTDVRVMSWDAWQKKNMIEGREGYGNPCLETKDAVAVVPTLPKAIGLPPNQNMPCDSITLNVAGSTATQHLAISSEDIRIELTQRDSNVIYTSGLSGIDRRSFQISLIDNLFNLSFQTNSGHVASVDNKGGKYSGDTDRLQLVCRTRVDAESVRDRFLSR